MKTAPTVRPTGQPSGPPSRGSVPLASLPFPAALLDSDATIVAVNPDWLTAHPEAPAGAGFLAFCEGLHQERADLRSALLVGVGNVLNRSVECFCQNYPAGTAAHRIMVSACGGDALVSHFCAPDADRGSDFEGLMQAQRMEAIGRLASGVAHDFANLVTLISGYSKILLARAGEHDPLRPELVEIDRAAERGARLTTQLLSYARGSAPQHGPLDLNAIVSGVRRMLAPIIGEHVELETVLAADLGAVTGDAARMDQVVMNLVLNARDALPTGGRIRIETANVQLAGAAAAAAGLAPGPYIAVTVSDTGHGIQPEAMPRLFAPFFTTKPEGKGTGLGLSTVQSVVSQSGGAVAVRSTPGEGAEFRVLLPRAPNGAMTEPEAAMAAMPGTETILLVEDDLDVRLLLAHVLQKKGYRVLQASAAEEARAIFAEHGAQIHLVLSDMVMPDMSGRELAEGFIAERPGLPVIFMSGYTDDVLTLTGSLRPGMSFLQKPLHPDTLAAKIRETLDCPAGPFNPR